MTLKVWMTLDGIDVVIRDIVNMASAMDAFRSDVHSARNDMDETQIDKEGIR